MSKKKQYKSGKSSKSNQKTSTSRLSLLAISVLILVSILIYYLFFNTPQNDETVVESGFDINKTEQGYPQLPNPAQIYKHNYFDFAYSTSLKTSYWVSYILTSDMVKSNTVDRQDEQFKKDPLLENNYAVHSDYSGSGYDRGHLCPAGDMNFDKDAMEETFFMSNILPQNSNLNRGIWKELEDNVRTWAVENDSLLVIVGGIFPENPKRIGKNQVAVPSKFYKIVADISDKGGYKMIAFVFDNKEYNTNDYTSNVITVDELEQITGIDFFAQYKNQNVEQLEANSDLNSWN